MALIKCSSCGHIVSDKGTKCPKCGTPITKAVPAFHTEKKDERVSEVESSINNIPHKESIEAETTISTGYKKKNRHKKKGIVAVVCGVLVIIAIAGGFYLWQNMASEKYKSQEKPVYSEELVKIAEKGNAIAQYDLGRCYANGYGVGKDYAEAVCWYRKSAEQGLAEAQCNLGVCYANGDGVSLDMSEAFRWYRKSAEQGNAVAQCNLGDCYDKGYGVVDKDYTEAFRWYRKSAEQGNAKAQYKLGRCYADGDGVGKDSAEAARWLRKSAKQGNAKAQYHLGRCYEKGFGVSQNIDEAIFWYKKAAEQEDKNAIRALKNIEKNKTLVIMATDSIVAPTEAKKVAVTEMEVEKDVFHTDKDVFTFVCGNRYTHADITIVVTEDGIYANGNKLSASPRYRRLSKKRGSIKTPEISITVNRENNTLIDNNSGDIYYNE